jgi:hypothetical protein
VPVRGKWMIAVGAVNWEHQQLEATLWCKATDKKMLEKHFHEVARRLYIYLKNDRQAKCDVPDFREAEINLALEDSPSDMDIPDDHKEKVRYMFAKGRFMDKQRRSYFFTEEIIGIGEVKLKELFRTSS